MGKRVVYPQELKKYVKKYSLQEKMRSILSLLGPEAQDIIDWAANEVMSESSKDKTDVGKKIFRKVAREAAIRLVQQNHRRSKVTTKAEVKRKTGISAEMPVLYKDAGFRHPQEARNLRHNIFHQAFLALIMTYFPDVHTWVPVTGQGSLTPDLIVEHEDPKWTIVVEYKGYRNVTLMSESEILKGMRYQKMYGTAWLVTSTEKSVHRLYSRTLNSETLIDQGIERLQRILKKKAYTDEQKENRGIARKGLKHLEKHRGINLRCKMISADDLIESCRNGRPLKGLAITTGMELVEMLRNAGLDEHADNILRVMKSPPRLVHSESVTSMRLIE